eukprot:gene46992-58630_t
MPRRKSRLGVLHFWGFCSTAENSARLLTKFGRASGIGLMSLSTPVSRRALRHTRAIDIQAFAREDGLWDLDAHITDIKVNATKLASGVRDGGMPLHDLSLRITVDRQLNIVAAEAVSDAFLPESLHQVQSHQGRVSRADG